jgi:SAM-dependent methyltransferase
VAGTTVPERIRWAVQVLAPAPGDHLLEIGCGPGVAVAAICRQLAGGRVVAIDRSATAIARAGRRNADCLASGRAVLRTTALEDLGPSDLPGTGHGFDKVFAMNVNLFWVRSPARELDLIRALLRPGARCRCSTAGPTGGPGPQGPGSRPAARRPSRPGRTRGLAALLCC